MIDATEEEEEDGVEIMLCSINRSIARLRKCVDNTPSHFFDAYVLFKTVLMMEALMKDTRDRQKIIGEKPTPVTDNVNH